MTFASYVLVVHARPMKRFEAGRNYLFLGVLGGLALLVTIMVLSLPQRQRGADPAAGER
jgi:hydrogenase-4 component B